MGSQHHLAVIKAAPITKTTIPFQPGPTVCHWRLERSDVHRTIRLDGESILRFSLVEYQLFWLLVEHCAQNAREVSYQEIASQVFGYALDRELLLVIRKRICAIRKKVAPYGIDIVSIPNHGYQLRSLRELALPYRRGHRAAYLQQMSDTQQSEETDRR